MNRPIVNEWMRWNSILRQNLAAKHTLDFLSSPWMCPLMSGLLSFEFSFDSLLLWVSAAQEPDFNKITNIQRHITTETCFLYHAIIGVTNSRGYCTTPYLIWALSRMYVWQEMWLLTMHTSATVSILSSLHTTKSSCRRRKRVPSTSLSIKFSVRDSGMPRQLSGGAHFGDGPWFRKERISHAALSGNYQNVLHSKSNSLHLDLTFWVHADIHFITYWASRKKKKVDMEMWRGKLTGHCQWVRHGHPLVEGIAWNWLVEFLIDTRFLVDLQPVLIRLRAGVH